MNKLVAVLIMVVMAVAVNAFAEPNRVPDGITGGVKYYLDVDDPSNTVNPYLGISLDLYQGDILKKLTFIAEGEGAFNLGEQGEYQGSEGSVGGSFTVALFGFNLVTGAAVIGRHDGGAGFAIDEKIEAVVGTGFVLRQ